ncbi:MOSC domain-containing protein [Cellulosimicrobium arenosum]|uniref:MOSC domain-containing protein n=1 Tax=Cellulosimicrobium arenosum TaxID=2708133 RepID=A0A927PEL2_9MICO|nr:MOSC domain-containing protein [Cellulosimicrobium arenosum]MBD8079921.1 MOSC domain-containing protein [Cellulosimicrobium arenosum]
MSSAAPVPVTELASSAPTGELVAVCRVHALLPDAGAVGVTAIDKRPVDGPVKVRRLGLYADVQADRAHHGGEDQAVYAYGEDDAEWWAGELGHDVPPGLFGENLRVRGVPVSGAVVGERWSVGSALLEVTQPRTPCATFGRRVEEERWVVRFTAANRTGTYLRVVRRGEVRAGDAVTVCYRPEHGVTIADWFAAWNGRGEAPDRAADLARRLLAAHLDGGTTLSDELRERAEIAAGQRLED